MSVESEECFYWQEVSPSLHGLVSANSETKLDPCPRLFLGLSTVSFEQIGGFDESYESWGLEDSDFVLRAQRHGLQLTDARYLISVLHLYHEEAPKGEKSQNVSQFENLISETSRVSPRRSILKVNPR